MSVKVVCDFCDRPLNFDLDRGSFVMYYPKMVDTRNLFPHLCKSCANKLDGVLNIYEKSMTRQIDIHLEQIRLNQERREKLGTKG